MNGALGRIRIRYYGNAIWPAKAAIAPLHLPSIVTSIQMQASWEFGGQIITMRIVLATIIGLLLALNPLTLQARQRSDLLIRHVTIVDVEHARALTDRAVATTWQHDCRRGQ